MPSQPELAARNQQPVARAELWNQLANAVSLRSSEDETLWAIFGAFWAANAILLVALFTTGDFPNNPWVSVLVAAVGTGLSLVWHRIQRRGLGHLQRHEALMQAIEVELQIPSRLAVSAEINRANYERFLGRGPRARTLMSGCSLGGAILWGIALASFVLEVW